MDVHVTDIVIQNLNGKPCNTKFLTGEPCCGALAAAWEPATVAGSVLPGQCRLQSELGGCNWAAARPAQLLGAAASCLQAGTPASVLCMPACLGGPTQPGAHTALPSPLLGPLRSEARAGAHPFLSTPPALTPPPV